MAEKQISSRKTIDNILHKWWLVFLLMVVGGGIGFLIATLQPARFEATARISTSIDYTLAPRLEDYQEDRAIQEAGNVIFSDAVLEAVQAKLADKGISLGYEDILDTFSIERVDDLWTLRVTSSDPQLAAAAANAWLEEAYLQLNTAFEHAQTAETLGVYLQSLDDCLYADPEEIEQYALCAMNSTEALTEEILEKTELRNEELELSRALFPAMRYALVNEAQVPTSATLHTRGILVLSGAMLGFLVSVLLVVSLSKKR